VAKCTVECGYSQKRWVAVMNAKWRERIERRRGVYVVGNVDPLHTSRASCRNMKKYQPPVDLSPIVDLENKSAIPLEIVDVLEIDGCQMICNPSRGFRGTPCVAPMRTHRAMKMRHKITVFLSIQMV
jgi:hypothetical protein